MQLISTCCSKLIASLSLLSYRRDYNNIFGRLNPKEGSQYFKILKCVRISKLFFFFVKSNFASMNSHIIKNY